ncbi:hypothetical protein BC832DRAFT_552870 [Gaertneriomyces semiglobifer]|nr:hypothetical protein BC832DRAFT_552870 [Gaertneriomyces semiglobifer]
MSLCKCARLPTEIIFEVFDYTESIEQIALTTLFCICGRFEDLAVEYVRKRVEHSKCPRVYTDSGDKQQLQNPIWGAGLDDWEHIIRAVNTKALRRLYIFFGRDPATIQNTHCLVAPEALRKAVEEAWTDAKVEAETELLNWFRSRTIKNRETFRWRVRLLTLTQALEVKEQKIKELTYTVEVRDRKIKELELAYQRLERRTQLMKPVCALALKYLGKSERSFSGVDAVCRDLLLHFAATNPPDLASLWRN